MKTQHNPWQGWNRAKAHYSYAVMGQGSVNRSISDITFHLTARHELYEVLYVKPADCSVRDIPHL